MPGFLFFYFVAWDLTFPKKQKFWWNFDVSEKFYFGRPRRASYFRRNFFWAQSLQKNFFFFKNKSGSAVPPIDCPCLCASNGLKTWPKFPKNKCKNALLPKVTKKARDLEIHGNRDIQHQFFFHIWKNCHSIFFLKCAILTTEFDLYGFGDF